MTIAFGTTLSKTHLDAAGDDPAQARAELEAIIDRLNTKLANVTLLQSTDLAANGGSVPETDRTNTFTASQEVKGSLTDAYNAISSDDSDLNLIVGVDSSSNNIFALTISGLDGAGAGKARFRAADQYDFEGAGVVVGSPTGGHKGAGTLNGELYDNGNRVVSDSNPATASEIATGAVGQSEVAASAIGQGELKTTKTTESLLNGGTSIRNTAAGQYGIGFESKAATESDGVADQCGVFFARAQVTSGSWQPNDEAAGTDTQGSFLTLYSASSSADPYAIVRYFQSSPPYDLGDGECGLFVSLDVLSDGSLAGASVAPDPVWANNGPTNIRPDYIDKATGKAYKRIRRPGVTREDVLAGRSDMADRVAALKEAPVEAVEITMAYKNADMDLFPHSWASPPQGTIVMLDPVNTHDLLMLHDEGEDVADLMHKGYIRVGDEVKRKGPPGVVPVMFKWSNKR